MRRRVVRAIISAGAPRALIGVSELWRPTPNIQICAGAGLYSRARVGVQAVTRARAPTGASYRVSPGSWPDFAQNAEYLFLFVPGRCAAAERISAGYGG